jgi:hypothetical protein
MMTMTRTDLCAMSGKMTNETVTSDEEQIHVIIRETGESIKSEAVHWHEHGGRETRMFIELYPMGVVIVGMVIGHGTLN